MRRIKFITIALLLAISGSAFSDTLFLKNGTRIHGAVSKNAEGMYLFEVEGRKSIYRPSEVIQHEENTLTGSEYRTRAKERSMEREKELIIKYGLNSQQRTAVMKVIRKFTSNHGPNVEAAQVELEKQGRKWNILRYLDNVMPSLNGSMYGPTLEVYCKLSSTNGGFNGLRNAASHPDSVVRTKALELLGKNRHDDAVALVSRGLVDPSRDVRLTAVQSLGSLRAKEMTGVLVELLSRSGAGYRPMIHNVLARLWQGETSVPQRDNPSEWNEFTSMHKDVIGASVSLDELEPLVDDAVFEAG